MKETKIFKNHDGTEDIWEYDDSISKNVIQVTIGYPKHFSSPEEQNNKLNLKLNKTDQKFFNESNGKYVGYQRAKQLGII